MRRWRTWSYLEISSGSVGPGSGSSTTRSESQTSALITRHRDRDLRSKRRRRHDGVPDTLLERTRIEERTRVALTAADDVNPAASDAGSGSAAVDVEVHLDELRASPLPDNLPLPTNNPKQLPLSELEPQVFERLIAEIVTLNRTSVHFYGRRGQRQYGLDIVEEQNDGTRILYQVKRYASAADLDLRATVGEYAGPPRSATSQEHSRRFDPTRFIIAISAPFDDDTNNVDTLADIQKDYRGDLQIDVWGAERISRELRRAVEVVFAMFGEAWAREWCGDDSVADARKEAQNRRRIITALNTAMSVQYADDDKVRFRQVALTDVSVDSLFVDVPVTADLDTETDDLLRRINPSPAAPAASDRVAASPLAGAAQALLHPDWSQSAVIVGGPGQGKSTLLQYLCQHHRARLLDRPHYSPIAAGLEPVTKIARAPLRVDLNDYAEWRRSQLDNPPTATTSTGTAERRSHDAAQAGLVPYLAFVVQQASGQPFTAEDLAVSLTRRPMLLALDGLDEVADPDDRETITTEIRLTESRLRTTAQDVLLLVATRPGNVSDPIWRSSQFATLYLTHLTDPLRMKYLDRWTAQSKLTTLVRRGGRVSRWGLRIRRSTGLMCRRRRRPTLGSSWLRQGLVERRSRRFATWSR
jgi:hypothetical protein